MEKKEIQRYIDWLVEEILMNPNQRSRKDIELMKRGEFGNRTVTLVTNLINELLSKAREEGREEVLVKIKEIFETNIPHGLYSPSETSYLYERFGGAIQQYYIDELSKLKDNK